MRSDNHFWGYSLRLYQKPGVEALCLDMQDSYGVNVNLLLFCCWQGSKGNRLTEGCLQRADAAIRVLDDEVVQPLRAVRRRIGSLKQDKPSLDDLYHQCKKLELEAERSLQDTLWMLACEHVGAGQHDDASSMTAHNLSVYLRWLGITLKPSALSILIEASYQ